MRLTCPFIYPIPRIFVEIVCISNIIIILINTIDIIIFDTIIIIITLLTILFVIIEKNFPKIQRIGLMGEIRKA